MGAPFEVSEPSSVSWQTHSRKRRISAKVVSV